MKTKNLAIWASTILILLIVNSGVLARGAAECTDGCECLTYDEAKDKLGENYERCSADICGYDRYQTPKYCFREEPQQCPDDCVCLADDEAKRKGLGLCDGETIRCTILQASTASVQYGHCYEEETSVCPDDCLCLTEKEAEDKFSGNYERCSADICGYDLYQTSKYCFRQKPQQCPDDCVCLADDEAKRKGLGLCDGETIRCTILQASTASVQYGHCYEEETSVCPDDCLCLTEKEAEDKFSGNYERCSADICGYDQYQTSKYCFRQKPQQCPDDCVCLADDEAKRKGLGLCDGETIRCTILQASTASVQYGHCYEREGETPPCPDDCVCLTEEKARERFGGNYGWCSADICGYEFSQTPAAVVRIPKYCFREESPMCPGDCICLTKEEGYAKKLDFCADDSGALIVCRVVDAKSGVYDYCFRTQLESTDCPDDCVCLVDDEAKRKGLGLCDGETIRCTITQASTADVLYGHCYEREGETPPCPDDCVCLTEEKARERFGGNYGRCSADICGYEYSQTLAAVVRIPKYCFREESPRCPGDCICLTKEEGYAKKLDFCADDSGALIVCRVVDAESGVYDYCFRQKPQQCPDDCVCLTDDEAKRKGLGLCDGETIRCTITQASTASVQYGHCYETEEETPQCPDGCVCLTDDEAKRKGLGLCNGETIRCTIAQASTASVQYGHCYEREGETPLCPDDCVCLTEEKARERFGGNYGRCSADICGYEYSQTPAAVVRIPKYCFREESPMCPGDCICLTKEEGYAKKLDFCADDSGALIVCRVVDAESGVYDYCFREKPGQCPDDCVCLADDEAKRKGLGLCDGETIRCMITQASTASVQYGHCYEREGETSLCPGGCDCMTKATGYLRGLEFCNNTVLLCGYEIPATRITSASTTADVVIPRYCFGKPVYGKCPDDCSCMSREDAYKRGYELCVGIVKQCGFDNQPLYCFEQPVSDCVDPSAVVKRRIDPKVVSPPTYINVYLTLKPEKEVTGIIITETIPKGIEPAWDYAVVAYGEEVEEEINNLPILSEIINSIKAEWTSRQPDSWDPKTRQAKWIIRNKDGIKPQTFMYKLKLSDAKQEAYILNGFWLISGGENCSIVGDDTISVRLMSDWPPCPISDLELLKYIDLWSSGELTDMQILQVIYVWAKKPPCN